MHGFFHVLRVVLALDFGVEVIHGLQVVTYDENDALGLVDAVVEGVEGQVLRVVEQAERVAEHRLAEDEVHRGIEVVGAAVVDGLSGEQVLLVLLGEGERLAEGAFRGGDEEHAPALRADGEVVQAGVVEVVVLPVVGAELGDAGRIVVEEHLGGDVGAVLPVGSVVHEGGAGKADVVRRPAEDGTHLVFHAVCQGGEQLRALFLVGHALFLLNLEDREFNGVENGI